MENIIEGISKYGFPIMAACGLGYFVFYIWKWVTKEIKPVIDDAMQIVINLIDNATRSSIEQNGVSLKIISDTVGTYANSDIIFLLQINNYFL